MRALKKRQRPLPWVAIFAALPFLWLALSPPLAAQVTGRQATPDEDPKQYFDSPMVLEVPFPWILDLPRAFRLPFGPELPNFICDDASIASLAVERGATRGKEENATTTLTLLGVVDVGSTRDKETHLQFSFTQSGREIFKVESKRFETEEEKSTPFKVKLKVSVSELEDLYRGKEDPVLKIIVRVWDD